MTDKEFQKLWNDPVNLIGRVTLLSAVVASFFPVVYLMISHKIFPPIDVVIKAWVLVASSYGVMYVLEPLSYYPVLGLAVALIVKISIGG